MTLPHSEPSKNAQEIIDNIGDRSIQYWNLVRQNAIEVKNLDNLNRLMGELSVLNFGLGTWLEKLEADERNAKDDLDLERAKIITELTEEHDYPISKAEIKATLETADKRREHTKAVNLTRKVKIARSSTDKLFESIRSSLSKGREDKQAEVQREQ